jgi:3',5'-cyclic AMP phosphodiesterase CpdA
LPGLFSLLLRQILHISDIHFGPHHACEVAAGVLDLVERRKPDLVAISGDLTQRAKPWQFRQARAFVDRLAAPAIVVPGNHDVPMYRFWERVFRPYGAYRKHFAAELEPVVEDDEMLVVGINSAHNWTVKDGRIRSSRLRQVAAMLEAAPSGQAKIVVVHHELVPAPRFDTQSVLSGSREAVEVFARRGVELVLAGHLHQSYVMPSEAFYPLGQRPFMIIHAGTTTSHRGRGSERRRYTCNWVRIEGDEIAVSHLGWDADAGGFMVRSRHHFPRRGREPYGLEVL